MSMEANILSALRELTNQKKGITIIKSKDKELHISYNTLWKNSLHICSILKKLGASKGSEVIITCKELEYFLYSFWACVMGGFIAVPMDAVNNEYKKALAEKVLDRLSDPYLLLDIADDSIFPVNHKSIDLKKVTFENFKAEEDVADPEPSDIVCIQFSSGSTGDPKGVVLRHSNLSFNINSVIEHYKMTQEDKVLSWQPLTHCYGLTTHHLLPIVLGVGHYLIPTNKFMQNPLLWMEKANEYRINRLGAIPFALKHFMSFYKNSVNNYNWDLSCVKSISVGGEQINAELINGFTEILKEQKLGQNVILPAYGLAEATTIVSTAPYQSKSIAYKIHNNELEIGSLLDCSPADTADGVTFLEVGTAVSSIQIKVLDDENKELPDKTLGYISVRGESVSKGYYNDAEATKEVFRDDSWLSTGDIGFLNEGRLVIVGREKELIVSKGKKYSCIQIENIIRQYGDAEVFPQIAVTNGMNSENNSELVIVFTTTGLNIEDTGEMDYYIEFIKDIKKAVYETAGVIVDEVIPVEVIPKTHSGKLKRRALSTLFNKGTYSAIIEKIANHNNQKERAIIRRSMSRVDILETVVEKLYTTLGISATDYDLSFQDYGIVSVNIPRLIQDLESEFNINLNVSLIFNYPSINQFVDYIYNLMNKEVKDDIVQQSEAEEMNMENKIAIVGMSCRFPGGANDLDQYWDVMMEGVDGVTDIPENRWDLKKYYDEDGNSPGKMYCKKSGFLNIPIDEFDARFFNISPKEAMATDPQQRLLLELTWEAFENGNIDITNYSGTDTGVYLGISSNEYTQSHLSSGDPSQIDAYSLTGTAFSTACGRISYTFGFEGPSFAVDTACSSSLTALHLACNALKSDEIYMGVVAGVSLIMSPTNSIGFTKLQATSPDGHSKAFDAKADGYGRGEGGGVLLVKKLSDAIKDQDDILGVICNTGINQDGKSNGLTAPNGVSQAKLIRRTLEQSKLSSLDIDYMEMHGTGTKLGDPIEVNAVAETYGENRTMDNPLRIGSVKSNIGHLEPASGVASIIKILLSFKNNVIPANLNFGTPNPFIDWNNIPIKVLDKPHVWIKRRGVRRAAVSGFGFGGSNAHAIIEEYKQKTSIKEIGGIGLNYVLKLSAKSEKSLREYIFKYIKRLEKSKDENFADIIYTANRGRTDFECRFAATGSSKEEMIYKLKSYLANSLPEDTYSNIGMKDFYQKNRKLVHMFTGQGSQYLNMGKTLYDSNEAFKEGLILCDRLFKPYILKSIIELLYGSNTSEELIEKTMYAQPLIFSIEYALYKMWESFGAIPEIVMGHSIGEYAAAVAAGIFSLEDAVKLVSIRGRLMDSAPGQGAMGTIFATESVVNGLIKEYGSTVTIAAHNAEETCVISGESEEVERILNRAEESKIRVRRLKVSHAFHSSLMNPVLSEFKEIADGIKYYAPKKRFASALYAREIADNEILGADYWTAHIREKVDFYHTILNLDSREPLAYLEVGSNRVLSALCKLILDESRIVAGSLNRKKEDAQQVADTIAMLYVSGVNINWNKIDFLGVHSWNKVNVPTYPYDKKSYWKELQYDYSDSSKIQKNGSHDFLGVRVESPYMNNNVVFQSIFTAEEPYFMGEHIIFNTPISPAAAHISMILSAVKELKNPMACTLKDVELRVPLAVSSGEERLVQVCMEDVSKDKMKFQIVSKNNDLNDSNWIIHVKGEALILDEYVEGDARVSISDFDAMPEDEVVPEDGVYAMMKNNGFNLGTGFRRIMKSSCKDGECVCLIKPADDIPKASMYELYPGVIDSILQSQLCARLDELHDKYDNKRKRTVIPYYLDDVSYNFRKSNELWIKGKSNVGEDTLYSGLTVYNSDGEVVMKISNMIANITDQNDLLREVKNGFNGLFYHNDWIQTEWNEMDAMATNINKYVLITDSEDFADFVADGFYAENKDMVSVIHNKGSFIKESSHKYNCNICEMDTVNKLLQSIIKDSGEDKIQIIYACGLDEENSSYSAHLKGLLNLVKGIHSADSKESVKIKVLTKNVQRPDTDKGIHLIQSPLWGFTKVLAIEAPNLFNGMVDVDKESLKSNQNILELMGSSLDEVSLYKGKRYISKLVKHGKYMKQSKEKSKALSVVADASYLITGGTGILGMVFAERLIHMGAKNLLLLCRHKPVQKVEDQILSWREMGVQTEIVYADICNKNELEKAISDIQTKVPSIRGIIHAAGFLNDKLMVDMGWEDCEKVLLPKIDGTMNVYESLDKENIDFFIMLSSMTSIVGNLGQSNYAAANYFMNRFAAQLRSEGVNAYAMCWGPWQSGGMAASNQAIDKNLSAMGIKAFSTETGSGIIEQFFAEPHENMMIADINWEKMSVNTGNGWQRQFLSDLLGVYTQDEVQNDDNSIIESLNGMENGDRKVFLIHTIQDRFGKIMGFEKGQKLLEDVGLREQGADSLMIFSMRTSLNKLLNTNIDVSTFFNYPTLNDLTDYLIDDILYTQEEQQDGISEDSTDEILKDLEALLN